MATSKRILILGGGFAGVYTAMHLEKALGRDPDIRIDLVNRDNYFVFQPMLPEVISGSIEILHVINPIRRLCPKTNLYMREVEKIDLGKKTVTISPGFRPRSEELPYDYLVLALGNISNFTGMPGLQEHGLPFKNLGDALIVRNHIIHVLEEADIEQDTDLRRKLLTFVVAGGGFSGVEVAAELNDFVRDVAPNFRNLNAKEMRVILLHSGSLILEKELKRELAEYAQKLLQRRGVEIILNTRLAGATAEEAIIKDKSGGTRTLIPTKTLIITVGSGPHPVLTALPCPLEKDRIVTNEYLEVPGYTNVWALGDCALIPKPGGKPGEYCPPTAQFALRQGRCAAENILASMRGTAKRPFAFSELGKMGALGHRSAVAEIFGFKVSGLFAWFLWRAIYLMKMPGWAKVRVGVDWLLDMLLPRDIVQIKTVKSESIEYEHFEPGQTIFREGDVGDRVYVIIKGQVEVSKRDGTTETVVATLGPEEYFGEMALLANVPRNATVRTLTAVDVMTVGRKDFTHLLTHLPAIRISFEQMMRQRLERPAKEVTRGPS